MRKEFQSLFLLMWAAFFAGFSVAAVFAATGPRMAVVAVWLGVVCFVAALAVTANTREGR